MRTVRMILWLCLMLGVMVIGAESAIAEGGGMQPDPNGPGGQTAAFARR